MPLIAEQRAPLSYNAPGELALAPKGLDPGIKVSTSPIDYFPFKQVQMMRFHGKRWVLFGEVLAQ